MKIFLLASVILTFFAASIVLLQMSCSKRVDAQTQSTNCIGLQAKIQFKHNGTQEIIDAMFDSRIGYVNSPSIVITSNIVFLTGKYGYGGPNPAVNLRINLGSGSSLSVGTFVKPGTCTLNGVDYPAAFTVIITSTSNGYANGTFSGTLNSPSTVTLTEGVISNLPIVIIL